MTVSCLSGFREKHSTQTSRHKLISVTQIKNTFYTDIQNGKIIGMLYLDLWKVFDTVYEKFFYTIFFEHYGLSGISLKWFLSYIENRTQMACISGHVSN